MIPAPDQRESVEPNSIPHAERDDANRSFESSELFQGAKELRIRHGKEVYRLIITRNNKLILHK